MADQLSVQFQELAKTANEEELRVLSLLLKGLKERKTQNGTYISKLLQLSSELGENSLTMSMPISSLVHNNLGIVHGGVIATLTDTAMGTLVNSVLPEGKSAVTAEIQIHYLHPANGNRLTCKAVFIHKGTKTMVLEGKVYLENGTLCAHSTATFYMIAAEPV
ncbi:PaaI family thioesterase [Bacillus sp. MUM 13]|uniref:PaaI family thioesterase n=1 Tax=Bacillus sp. MUM 13 TaxID=1678001 RepID=UPI0008F5DC22|nr:PaaI family thioesterase [Bacillus sp. MUM 13]OIK15165.1 hypothetical protein BIV59_00060 [Bacillus sp. MUM 13]